jgi:hypothetical protein
MAPNAFTVRRSPPKKVWRFQNPDQPFRFLDLPKEIRLMVYEFLPLTRSPLKLKRDGRRGGTLLSFMVYTIPDEILRTCRMINREASVIIRSKIKLIETQPVRMFALPECLVNQPFSDTVVHFGKIFGAVLEAYRLLAGLDSDAIAQQKLVDKRIQGTLDQLERRYNILAPGCETTLFALQRQAVKNAILQMSRHLHLQDRANQPKRIEILITRSESFCNMDNYISDLSDSHLPFVLHYRNDEADENLIPWSLEEFSVH